jgi:hypothetical protein
MKFFRLGSSLALLMAGIACTQSPQTATSPTAASSTVAAATAAADGSTLKVGPPGTVSPTDGQTAEDKRPTLVWTNAEGKYAGIGVAYDIELSTPEKVVYSTTVGETPDFGAHLIPFDLDYAIVYSWRVRAHIGNPDTYGPWSNWATFKSMNRPTTSVGGGGTVALTGGCAAPISQAGTRIGIRPNDSAVVRAVASAYPGALSHSCQPEGGSWEFMDRTVDALRSLNGRYGYNAKRGNMNDPSLDVVSFFRGPDGNNFQGSSDVYIFDLISGHCGPTPGVIWNDVTDITFDSGTLGRTMYPRPGRNVDTSSCAAPK